MDNRKFPAQKDARPRAIVMHCIDPRFSLAFEQFIEQELGLNRHNDIVMKLAGGPAPLACPKRTPSRYKQLKKALQFKSSKFESIERVIAIAHSHCAYYSTIPFKFDEAFGELEKTDLAHAGAQLIGILPKKRIELYHAKLVDNDEQILFEKVKARIKLSVVN